jgi:hypothetical protein
MVVSVAVLAPPAALTRGKPTKRFLRVLFVALFRLCIMIIDEVVNIGYKEQRLINQTHLASNI